jgi:glycosyltransferase involved in cell wall biosynthesis
MARIGICHFRVGELDGVSLEIDKCRRVLEWLGHQTFLCAGRCGSGGAFVIPELALDHPEVVQIRKNALERLADYPSEDALHDHIEDVAARVEAGVKRFVTSFGLDLLIVHNIWGLPINLPATIGVWRAVQDLHLPAIAHHHDFYWEKDDYRSPTCPLVRNLLAEYYPPRSPRVTHIVINRLAQEELRHRGVPAVVVPNVFDFSTPLIRDDLSANLREQMGLSPEDVVFLQATRVVRRKGIEIAVELVARLALPEYQGALAKRVRARGGGSRARPVLLLPNLVEDPAYAATLQERIAQRGVHALFVSDKVALERKPPRFSFWDTYLCADFVTYPSLQEGWGNQLLEAIWAKLPVALYEYPVFRSDIAPVGFRYVSLGNSHERDEMGLARVPESVLRRAAREVADLLASPDLYRRVVEHNFALGKTHFSLETLAGHLDRLVTAALGGRPAVDGPGVRQ